VSVPIYYATGSRGGRSLVVPLRSRRPIGALAGFALLKVVAPEEITGCCRVGGRP